MSHAEGRPGPTRKPETIDYEPWTWRRSVPALVAGGLGVLIVIGAVRPPGLSPGAPFRVLSIPSSLGPSL